MKAVALQLPRDLIRKGLPLKGLHPRVADHWVTKCLSTWAHDPDRRDLQAIITTYRCMMLNLKKENNDGSHT